MPNTDSTMPRSREGWQWAASDGLTPGLPTQAVIEPAQSIASPSKVYDVLVIGAGYAGLTATRDLAAAGQHIPSNPTPSIS